MAHVMAQRSGRASRQRILNAQPDRQVHQMTAILGADDRQEPEMSVLRERFVQPTSVATAAYAEVSRISDLLHTHLNEPAAQAALAIANVPNASSGLVQETFVPYATELGFKSEAKGLFADYENKFLRPDYYLPLGESGIIPRGGKR